MDHALYTVWGIMSARRKSHPSQRQAGASYSIICVPCGQLMCCGELPQVECDCAGAVLCKIQQVHDLRHPCPRHLPASSQFRIVGHEAVVNESFEANRHGHQQGIARDPAPRDFYCFTSPKFSPALEAEETAPRQCRTHHRSTLAPVRSHSGRIHAAGM